MGAAFGGAAAFGMGAAAYGAAAGDAALFEQLLSTFPGEDEQARPFSAEFSSGVAQEWECDDDDDWVTVIKPEDSDSEDDDHWMDERWV